MSLTHNSDSAEELVSVTIFKFLNNQSSFKPGTNLQAFLTTILRNENINNFRHNKISNGIIDKSKDVKELNIVRKSNITPISHILIKEINAEIDRLPEDLKAVLIKYMEGYKYEEIATNLHLKLGTVKNRLFRARELLMKRLK